MDENKELSVVKPQAISAEAMIRYGLEKGIPVESLEKLLAMRRELKAEDAKEQFIKSMAEFQLECPAIKKNKEGGKTDSGVVAYHYAPLDSIIEQTKKLIKQHGFSYAINTTATHDTIKVTCIVRHEAGHSETSEMEVPSGGGTKIMSVPQRVAAAMTFAKRYAFCNAFGIMTSDEDNDSNLAKPRAAGKKEFDDSPNYARAKAAIEKATDPENLKEMISRVDLSRLFIDEEKKSLLALINAKLPKTKPGSAAKAS